MGDFPFHAGLAVVKLPKKLTLDLGYHNMDFKMRSACFLTALCVLATSEALLLPEQYTQVGKKVMPARSSNLLMPCACIAFLNAMGLRKVLASLVLA